MNWRGVAVVAVAGTGLTAAAALWPRDPPVEVPAPSSNAPVTLARLLEEMVDPSVLARWPDPAYRPVQHTSTDPRSVAPGREGWFANDDRGHFIRTEQHQGRSEHVLFEAEGAGAIVRMWSANPGDGGTLRIYVDGSDDPVVQAPLEDWLAGRAGAPPPLAARRGRGFTSYLPVPFQLGCRVTVDDNRGKGLFYAVSARSYPDGTVRSATPEELRSAAVGVAAQTLVAPWPGPGGERHHAAGVVQEGSALALALPAGPAAVHRTSVRVPRGLTLDELWLVGTFDGDLTLEAPLGGLFGTGPEGVAHEGWLRRSEASGLLQARLVMPYAAAGHLQIEHRGTGRVPVELSVQVEPWSWDSRSMHLHAAHRSEPVPTRPRHDWELAHLPGPGVYVGDTLAVHNPVQQWWGGGDERVTVDGEAVPSLLGTGTEDYYGYAWCANEVFSGPFHAQPRNDQPPSDDACRNSGGHITNTRVRSLDALPFERSLTVDLEIWHWEDTTVHYAGTALWYAK